MSVLFALLLLFSCSSNSSTSEEAEHTLHPLIETEEITDLSTFIDTIEFIQLKDDERLLVSDISKALIDNNKNIHLLDFQGRIVSIKPDGSYFGSIAQRGRAVNEYLGVTDIALTDNELVVLESPTVKFFNINDSGLTRKIDIKSDIPFDAVSPYGNGGVYVFSAFPPDFSDASKNKGYLLSIVNSEGEIISQEIKREDCTFSIGNISQSYKNIYYLRPQNNRHIFYRLSDKGIIPEYCIDFGEKTIPNRYYYNSAEEDISKYMFADYYKLPMDLHVTQKHLFFHASGPSAEDICFIYNIKSQKGIRWKNIGIDAAMPIFGSDEEYFYTLVQEFENYDVEQHGVLSNYIIQYLQKNNMPATATYIIKLKFNI